MEMKNMLNSFFWKVQTALCLYKQSFFTAHYIPAWVSVKNYLQNVYCLLFRMPIFVKMMLVQIIECNGEEVYRCCKVLRKG